MRKVVTSRHKTTTQIDPITHYKSGRPGTLPLKYLNLCTIDWYYNSGVTQITSQTTTYQFFGRQIHKGAPNTVKLSICIPTYNRATHLGNCLHSIYLNHPPSALEFEVCVSDNCSEDETEQTVRILQNRMAINYTRNASNLGRVMNYLNVVEMATGEFIWLLGDDDFLLPSALTEIGALLMTHQNCEFFYINSYHLNSTYVSAFPAPFDTRKHLPQGMQKFSAWPRSGQKHFMDLINPKLSFDFLGGMFLAVFRAANWRANIDNLDHQAICDPREFSSFDNTFPHIKIFAKAFAKSQAFYCAQPLSICLSGIREWTPLWPLVRSVRLIEAVEEYRRQGLPILSYILCKNYALRNFLPDFAKMFLHRDSSGIKYISPLHVLFNNILYPNVYLSVIYLLARKILLAITNLATILKRLTDANANEPPRNNQL